MAYNLEPRTIKENLLGLIGKNPHAEPRPANTREECFLADIAENGGGGGLPPYTSADKGKGLFLGDGEGTETVVIVPEQTVTVPAEAQTVPLANVEYGVDDFTAGMTGIVTVNIGGESTDIPVTFGTEQGVTGFLTSNPDLSASVLYINGWQFAAGEPEEGYTCTLSLTASVPSVEPKWESGGGVLFLRCVSGGTVTQAGLRIPFNKTAAKIISVLNVSGDTYNGGSLTPIFVDIPVVASLSPSGYSYEDGENIVLISNYKAFLDSTLDIYTDNNFRYFITYDMENNTPSAFYLTIAPRE